MRETTSDAWPLVVVFARMCSPPNGTSIVSIDFFPRHLRSAQTARVWYSNWRHSRARRRWMVCTMMSNRSSSSRRRRRCRNSCPSAFSIDLAHCWPAAGATMRTNSIWLKPACPAWPADPSNGIWLFAMQWNRDTNWTSFLCLRRPLSKFPRICASICSNWSLLWTPVCVVRIYVSMAAENNREKNESHVSEKRAKTTNTISCADYMFKWVVKLTMVFERISDQLFGTLDCVCFRFNSRSSFTRFSLGMHILTVDTLVSLTQAHTHTNEIDSSVFVQKFAYKVMVLNTFNVLRKNNSVRFRATFYRLRLTLCICAPRNRFVLWMWIG